ncbi:hypothetical protein MHY1_02795 [Methylovirgula sp. HY1]|nr:hypothetical protein MHY1_02795 [Methylovirgula sp. HY1]
MVQPPQALSSETTGVGTGSCMKARGMTDKEGWVVYNGSLGIADKVIIGLIEEGEGGRSACLAPPYDAVGPFNLDELESEGRVAFGACLVLSLSKWRELQDQLRLEAQEKRRALMLRQAYDDQEDREVLHLPLEGELTSAEINAAFRRLAKIAHPDVGGSDEDYCRITEARDALLELFADAS